MPRKPVHQNKEIEAQYEGILDDLCDLIQVARQTAARSVNSIMATVYWLIGRRLVEMEQRGQDRAEYGEALVSQLADDLTVRFGRGFAKSNLYQMRGFYLAYKDILQTVSGKSIGDGGAEILQTVSGKLTSVGLSDLAQHFPLPWSAYVRLLTVKSDNARQFYETEALRGGWSVRQLTRQIDSQFYERTALSKNKTGSPRKKDKNRHKQTGITG